MNRRWLIISCVILVVGLYIWWWWFRTAPLEIDIAPLEEL